MAEPPMQAQEQPSAADVRRQLHTIVNSPQFLHCERLARFLTFIVEETLEGRAASLKEYVIGTQVYDLSADFDPGQNSLVRSEARRLRGKLKSYNDAHGKHDLIAIQVKVGSYVPIFQQASSLGFPSSSALPTQPVLIPGQGVTVLILPFTEIAGSLALPSFADGLTDEFIHHMSAVAGMRVIAAGSISQVIAGSPDIPSLAARLGADVVFQGTVRQQGNRFRNTIRLVNADGLLLWSQRFDLDLHPPDLLEVDVFDVQESIASAIMNRVGPQLSLIRSYQASAGPAVFAIYPLLLAAESLLDSARGEDIHAALVKFQAVAASVPQYARPWCGIAQCFYWTALRGAANGRKVLAQAASAALQALRLDPNMVEAHSTLGAIRSLQWDFAQAQLSFSRASSLGSQAVSLRQESLFLCSLSHFEDAWTLLERAQRIDAFSTRQQICCARFFFLSRRYTAAEPFFAVRLSATPEPVECQVQRAFINLYTGRGDDAARFAATLHLQAGPNLALQAYAAELSALAGDKDLASSITQQTGLLLADAQLSRFRKAALTLALGLPDEALSLLNAACKEVEPELIWLAADPRFDQLRQNSSFTRLIEQVHTHCA